MEKAQKFLTHADSFVTLTANTASVLTPILTAEVPRGLAWVIPGKFPLILKLQKSDGSEIGITSEFYFFIKIPSEGRIYFPVSSRFLYHPWADLSIAEQRDADYRDSLVIDLGVDFLPLVEEESLVIQLYSSDQIDTSKVRIYIPYFERAPAQIQDELAYRAEVLKL